jgi:hypothetical protein
MANHKIHIKDAIALLESGKRVNLRVWKLSTGDIIDYRDVVCIGSHWRGGTLRIMLPYSGLVREFRDITLFEINGMEIYR